VHLLILKIFRYLYGYVRFIVIGEFPERLLNQFSINGISAWNIIRKKDYIEASILVRDYRQMRKVRAKSGVRTKIQQKYGFPFLIRNYSKRLGFLIGIACFFMIISFMSSFVWNIEICGNNYIETDSILSALYDLGLKEGTKINEIDSVDLRTKLALKVDNIAWAAINIEGSKVTVDISENKIVEEKAPSDPCNLVAKCDGVILNSEVIIGNSVVKNNTAVLKGQLLVSGIVEYKDGSSSLRHATGKVNAYTNHTLSAKVDFKQMVTRGTDNILTRSALKLFTINVPLYLGSVRGDYTKKIASWRYQNKNMYLPVTVTTATFTQNVTEEIVFSEQETTQMAKQKLMDNEKSELGEATILSKTENIIVNQDSVEVKADYVCEENIAVEEILLISTTK